MNNDNFTETKSLTCDGFPLPSLIPTNLKLCHNVSLQTFDTEELGGQQKAPQIKNKADLHDGKASGQFQGC